MRIGRMVASCSSLVLPLWLQKSYLVAVVVLLLKQCWCWWWRRRRRIFEEDPTRRRRVLLDRLAESSRGLTAALLLWNDDDGVVVLVEWIEKLASSKRCRNQKAVIDFIGGAFWFRFHVVGDYQLQLTAASKKEDCDALLQWTLELMPPFNLYALTKCCIEAILALDADVLPAKVVELLLEEVVLLSYYQHHQHEEEETPSDCPASMRIRECSQRIQCYMTFLNLLKRSDDDHEGLVRVSDACSIFSFPPHQHHLPLFRRQRFVERLFAAAAADDSNPLILRAFLPRICTNLRFYQRAQRLLKDSATAQAYCCLAAGMSTTTTIASGGRSRSGVLLTAAQKWIQDAEYLATSMQEGLVFVPKDFRAGTLCCMVDCLVQRAAAVAVTAAPGEDDNHHDLRSLSLSGPQGEEWNDCLAAADAFCLLASSNLPLTSSSSSGSASMDAALACLEHASNIMMRLFTNSCFGIAQATWYVGIVLLDAR